MRPRIVQFLADTFNTELLSYLVPTGTTIYVFTIFCVTWVFIKRCESSGLCTYHALRASIFTIVGGILGARIFYLLQHIGQTIDHPYLIFNLTGGTASWGAYLGAICCFSIYLGRKKLPILMYADVLGTSLGLGPFIGRWSCFLNGCCYGKLSNLPWAVKFPQASIPYRVHLKAGLINPNETLSLSVHPVQIYSSLAALIIFFIVSKFWINHRDKPGRTFAFYWLLYCTIRFGIEFFRGDVERYSGLSLSQIICLIIVALVPIIFFLRTLKNYKI